MMGKNFKTAFVVLLAVLCVQCRRRGRPEAQRPSSSASLQPSRHGLVHHEEEIDREEEGDQDQAVAECPQQRQDNHQAKVGVTHAALDIAPQDSPS